LEGVLVLEFGAYAAGPAVGKYLAEFGATVVHVESRARPDGFRTGYPPYRDNRPHLETSGCFAFFNDSKLGITLNLKAPGATELARRAVARADVVIETFTPGTMERLGLDPRELVAENPGLVVLRSCNLGQTGPYARQPGFGSQLTSLAGFTHLIGYPDSSPYFLYGPYIDYIAVGFGAVAVLAALDARRRTGRGQVIDLSQWEAGLQFLAPVLLDYFATGRVATRQGNRSDHAAPHGAYRCADGAWCALAVRSDDEWGALCRLAGWPELAADPRFATLAERKRREAEVDARVAAWFASRPAAAAAEALQRAGLAASVVQTMRDLYEDPQLLHRRYWRAMEHPYLGRFRWPGPPCLLSETPGFPRWPAFTIGEHNRRFYREILGLTEEEYRGYVERGVID
jgi:benzylsuccinate CoA-transferase BbsF subunit